MSLQSVQWKRPKTLDLLSKERQNSNQIINDDVTYLFYLLFILWSAVINVSCTFCLRYIFSKVDVPGCL
jgi:hypothetical protein